MELYKIRNTEHSDGTALVRLELNPAHAVYQGHFPGMPVLPGALQVEIIKELFAKILDAPLRLDSAKSIKYLGFVVPGEHPVLDVELKYKTTESGYGLRAQIRSANDNAPKIFMKFSGQFSKK
jgi:3-hydroxyacyl-[acyl-carrier-protein] dehydratase